MCVYTHTHYREGAVPAWGCNDDDDGGDLAVTAVPLIGQ